MESSSYSSSDDCAGEADIEEIVNHRKSDTAGTYDFQVKFEGYPSKCNLWYHESDLMETMPEAVETYMRTKRLGKFSNVRILSRKRYRDEEEEEPELYEEPSEESSEESSSSESSSSSSSESSSSSPEDVKKEDSSSSEDVPLWIVTGLPDPDKLPEDWSLTEVCTYFQKHPVSKLGAERRRKIIVKEWSERTGKSPNFLKLNSADTTLMFQLIDRDMFAGKIEEYLREHDYRLEVLPNMKSTSTAGWCRYPRKLEKSCRFRITLSTEVFMETFQDEETCHVANGIGCCSRAECLEIVLEHEIVHMLVKLFCPHSGRSHGKNFMTIARGVFGHKDFYHSLHRGDGMEILADQDVGTKNKELIRKLRKKGSVWIKYRKVRISEQYGVEPEVSDHFYAVKSVGPRNIILENGSRIKHGNYHIVGIYQDKDGENFMKWSEDFRSDGDEIADEEEEYPSWIERDSYEGNDSYYGDE